MSIRMCPDDLAWEQAEVTSEKWLEQFLEVDNLRPIAEFILTHNRGDADEFAILRKGSYNISLRLKYPNSAAVIRLSQPGAVMFPEEKIVNEVAVMRFIADQTSIPVPFILHSGSKDECPLNFSPFIIMDYIPHETKMYAALNRPECPKDERGVLNPDIDEEKLEFLYGQLAGVLLQLSKAVFPCIGSLSQVDDFTWEVTRRSLSMNMNELVRVGGLPRSKIPNKIFGTSSSYIEALAELNMSHLVYQRNDSIESADDCRRKFLARHLFRKLAREKKLTNSSLENGPFKMWCDDLRPANVLLDKGLRITGVIDWEFTYAAPAEFSFAPPWWLLIEQPEHWENGIEDWEKLFEPCLKTFIRAMTSQEDAAIQQGILQESQRLSGHMQASWDSGDFWIVYALLHSFAFDEIYWKKIDPRFFTTVENPEEAWKERLDLLNESEKEEMEMLVTRKLEQMKTRVLSWDPDEYTVEFREKIRKMMQEQSSAPGR
ncbi:hypothetical protein N7456_012465 [Penicillium angulare]|uniref:Aminoglycoside phosphotransferase domain-containing protein n=1 Tax=Penicillium angulare TaxID=116970 RepID=A0A9W9EVU9_9EURO|nr:hypothetical protein N7456_012465 [Penicillium angulare]